MQATAVRNPQVHFAPCGSVIYKLHSMPVIEIRHYVSRTGKDVFDEWLSQLADARAQAKIASRINRLAAGNFGDCKATALRCERIAD